MIKYDPSLAALSDPNVMSKVHPKCVRMILFWGVVLAPGMKWFNRCIMVRVHWSISPFQTKTKQDRECWQHCCWKKKDPLIGQKHFRQVHLRKRCSALSWKEIGDLKTHTASQRETRRDEQCWKDADQWSLSGEAKTGHWSQDIHKWKIHGHKKLLRQGPGTRGQALKPQLTRSAAPLIQQDEGKKPTCATRKAEATTSGRGQLVGEEGEEGEQLSWWIKYRENTQQWRARGRGGGDTPGGLE